MRVILRSGQENSARRELSGPELRLLTPWSDPWQEFLGNLRAAFDRRRPLARSFRDIFPNLLAVYRPGQPRERALLASTLSHIAVLALVWHSPAFQRLAREAGLGAEKPRPPQHLTWYKVAERLPAIRPQGRPDRPPSERGGKRPGPSPKGATDFGSQQVIISNPPQPDNARQTIVQPDAPNIRITRDVRLPNIVLWRDVEKPLPPVDLVKQAVAKLRLPAELIHKNVDLPEEVPNLERRIADLKMAAAVAANPSPKLPVEPATTTAGNAPPETEPAPPPAPASVAGMGGPQNSSLRRLIAIGVNPAPPEGPIEVPPGNRSGAFSIGPEGKTPGTPYGSVAGLQDAGGVGPGVAGEGGGAAGGDLKGIHVPGLSVSGGNGPSALGPVVTGPPRPAAPPAPRPAMPSPLRPGSGSEDPANRLARALRPQLPEWGGGRPGNEPGFSPGKKVYTMYINMPNLASGAGSWILRFAELEERLPGEAIELAAPVAVHKVDPGYVPDAIREKVEGQVVLRAIIRKDGHVEHIEVLRGLDPRLDLRAVQALGRWEFQPATRNGSPVDLEAVVLIPFALPRAF